MDDDNNNGTATTLDLRTTLVGDKSGSESEGKAEAEDFAMDNAQRPPPAEIMYNGQGKTKPNKMCADMKEYN